MQVLWIQPPTKTVPGVWEDLSGMCEGEPLKAVCRSAETKKEAVHDMEQNITADRYVDMVIITSFNFNSIQLVEISKLKSSSYQNRVIIPYKVHTGSDGNVDSYHVFNIPFHSASKEHLEATKREVLC